MKELQKILESESNDNDNDNSDNNEENPKLTELKKRIRDKPFYVWGPVVGEPYLTRFLVPFSW